MSRLSAICTRVKITLLFWPHYSFSSELTQFPITEKPPDFHREASPFCRSRDYYLSNILRSNPACRRIAKVIHIPNSFLWQGTTVYLPVLSFLSIQWLHFWWCSTKPCFFNNLMRSFGLILHLGILFPIIKWNSFFFYILLHSFQITLNCLFYMFL